MSSNPLASRAEMIGMSPEAMEEVRRLETQFHEMCGPRAHINDMVPYMFGLIADLRTRLERAERQLRGQQEAQR